MAPASRRISTSLTRDEFFDDDEDAKSVNEVEDVPQGFKDWVKDNEERIDKAADRVKLPYFIADNKNAVTRILKRDDQEEKESTTKKKVENQGSKTAPSQKELC